MCINGVFNRVHTRNTQVSPPTTKYAKGIDMSNEEIEVFYLIAWVDECAYGPMPSLEVATEYAAEISLWDGSFEVRNNPNGYYVKAPSAAFLGAHV